MGKTSTIQQLLWVVLSPMTDICFQPLICVIITVHNVWLLSPINSSISREFHWKQQLNCDYLEIAIFWHLADRWPFLLSLEAHQGVSSHISYKSFKLHGALAPSSLKLHGASGFHATLMGVPTPYWNSIGPSSSKSFRLTEVVIPSLSWNSLGPQCSLHNQYGHTESSMISLCGCFPVPRFYHRPLKWKILQCYGKQIRLRSHGAIQ